jgi:hypothetical protein
MCSVILQPEPIKLKVRINSCVSRCNCGQRITAPNTVTINSSTVKTHTMAADLSCATATDGVITVTATGEL